MRNELTCLGTFRREGKATRLLLLLASAALTLTGTSSGQTGVVPQNETSTKSSSTGTSSQKGATYTYLNDTNKNAIKITLKVSRQQAVAGSDFGITAILENTSASAIYFVPGAFSMTPPPEIDVEGPRDWLAFFPGILVPPKQDYYDTVIVLEPGSSISAFWTGQKSSASEANSGKSVWSTIAVDTEGFIRSLTFSPGQYSLAIVGSYWDTHEGAQAKSVEHHTQTAEIIETITAPQKVVLLGAALGGIIAFLLLTRLYPSGAWSGVSTVTGIVSAVLLSTIVTVLLARLSQSQFIVQVTVNDFWGAMAVGFLITAAGPPILQKFTTLVQGTPSQAGAAQPEAVHPGPVKPGTAQQKIAPAEGPVETAPRVAVQPTSPTDNGGGAQTSGMEAVMLVKTPAFRQRKSRRAQTEFTTELYVSSLESQVLAPRTIRENEERNENDCSIDEYAINEKNCVLNFCGTCFCSFITRGLHCQTHRGLR